MDRSLLAIMLSLAHPLWKIATDSSHLNRHLFFFFFFFFFSREKKQKHGRSVCRDW